ncbi:MAG: type I methionyl aminopeptidase [Planctomycetales bacterium]|nr:type I methionyl aminopeptidase [Planctomycetales bacterium]
MRNLKSKREITQMRRAGLAVWQAHQIAAELVRPGVTTGKIDAAVDEYYTEIGGFALFRNYPHGQRGKPAFPAVTCISVNDEVVHGIPGPRVLEEGDVVSIDTGVRIDGWCGDAAITHPVGQVESEPAKLLEVTTGVLNLAIELLAVKKRWSEVAQEMAAYVSDHGFYTVESFVGHGIGREMHEDPQVPNFVNKTLRASGDFPIEPGLVIAVEPMVNIGTKRVKSMPDHWTQCTFDGKASAHFEHTIAITEEGPQPLTVGPTPEEENLGILRKNTAT